MSALDDSRAAAANAMAAADQARHQANEERRETQRRDEELAVMRETLAMEATRRINAERVAAAAEHAAMTAAEDAEYARELLEHAGHRTPNRHSPVPDYDPQSGAMRSAAAETLNAAAEAAELLEELKGGLRVSVEHQRSLQDMQQRYASSKYNYASPTPKRNPHVQYASSGARVGSGYPAQDYGTTHNSNGNGNGPKMSAQQAQQSAHARAMQYGRQVAGKPPNVGYGARLENGSVLQGNNNYGPPLQTFGGNRPTERLKSPYLDPNSASNRWGRAVGVSKVMGALTSNPGATQWATPAVRRAKRSGVSPVNGTRGFSRGGDPELEVFHQQSSENVGALEHARREYAADKRAAMERRRHRMSMEEGAPQA